GRHSSLDLEKHDAAHLAVGKAIEDDEIHRRTEKARILWIVVEVGEIGDELLVDLADRHSLALLNRILADGGCVARPPGQEVHPCDQEPDREADRSEERRVGKECRSRWSPPP